MVSVKQFKYTKTIWFCWKLDEYVSH